MINRNKLRERRLMFGYTQSKIEELTGVERTRYNKIETGNITRISLFDAFAISKALGTSIEELFDSDSLYQESNSPTGTDN